MKNNKGFSLIEVLVASSIIIMMITTFVPITTLLSVERDVLSDRRLFASRLHDELQPVLWNEKNPPKNPYTRVVNSVSLTFDFIFEGESVKGCVQWQNAKKITEEICLYGYPQE